jgi:hypothetical protein
MSSTTTLLAPYEIRERLAEMSKKLAFLRDSL